MRRLRGLTVADLLIGLAVVALMSALVLPTVRARSFRSLTLHAVSEVDAVRDAVTRSFAQRGSWPAPTEAGEIPPGRSPEIGADSSRARPDYTIRWSVWEIVEHVEAPPMAPTLPGDAEPPAGSVEPTLVPMVGSLGGIVLYSANEDLLAELLARYGSQASFVRDTTWTLIVDRPAIRP